jgi:hypothetical protein
MLRDPVPTEQHMGESSLAPFNAAKYFGLLWGLDGTDIMKYYSLVRVFFLFEQHVFN